MIRHYRIRILLNIYLLVGGFIFRFRDFLNLRNGTKHSPLLKILDQPKAASEGAATYMCFRTLVANFDLVFWNHPAMKIDVSMQGWLSFILVTEILHLVVVYYRPVSHFFFAKPEHFENS